MLEYKVTSLVQN